MKVHELFEDATIPQLQQSIQVGFPNTTKRQHATNEVRVDSLKYKPARGSGLLDIISTTTSDSGHKYQQQLQLRKVTYEDGDTPNNDTFVGADGQRYSIQPVPLTSTTVGVSCSCADYIMRFAAYNIDNNCHVGPMPPRYVRKTTNRPPANPNHVPGMCKHLLKVVDDLEGYGLLA